MIFFGNLNIFLILLKTTKILITEILKFSFIALKSNNIYKA